MSNKIGGLLITKINFLSGRIFTKMIKKDENIEINRAQGRILFALSKFGDMSINDLCMELSLSKSTLTSMLDRLYITEYIDKRISEKDKRLTIISLKNKAKEPISKYEKIVSEMEKIYYKDFSEEDIKIFEEYLSRVYKNLEDMD